MLEKTNIPGYLKDIKTKAVLNSNRHEKEQYLVARNKFYEINRLNEKIETMTLEVDEIKRMMAKILLKQEGN